jgi:HPt (histidine-containing phosphotransfer) domain-containing protein
VIENARNDCSGSGTKHDKLVVHADPDLMDIIPQYLENKRHNIGELLEALNQGDFEFIRATGHNLKGSGSGYGFEEITRLGAEIETKAKEKDTEAVRMHISGLSAYLDRIEIVYE